jgi:hypothetical protein
MSEKVNNIQGTDTVVVDGVEVHPNAHHQEWAIEHESSYSRNPLAVAGLGLLAPWYCCKHTCANLIGTFQEQAPNVECCHRIKSVGPGYGCWSIFLLRHLEDAFNTR